MFTLTKSGGTVVSPSTSRSGGLGSILARDRPPWECFSVVPPSPGEYRGGTSANRPRLVPSLPVLRFHLALHLLVPCSLHSLCYNRTVPQRL